MIHEQTLTTFVELVQDACHFMKKDNRNYPIRYSILNNKANLVRILYRKGYCVECQEFVQHNKNVNDVEPYVLVRTTFRINNQLYVFHTPKKQIYWLYELTNLKVDDMEIIPAKKVNFTIEQIIKISMFLKNAHSIFNEEIGSRKRLLELDEFMSWRTSDKLRKVHAATGIFD